MVAAKKSDKSTEGTKLREEGAKWIARIEAAGKLEKLWMDDADRAVKAFTGELSTETSGTALGSTYDFNILYANVETIVPAVINSPPAPDIRRRFADDDTAGKDVAELLERVIRVQVDDSKLQTELEAQAHDAFLAGRGVIRLRFKSDFLRDGTSNDELADAATDATGETPEREADDDQGSGSEPDLAVPAGEKPAAVVLERLANERITFEAVSWRDYRHGPAKRWDERPWEAFRFCIPREDESTAFDAAMIGSQITDGERKERGSAASDLTGWEVWCGKTRKVKFIDDSGVILKTVDDPLGWSGFFSTGTPVQPITLTGRLMPVNPFSIYRKLADELDLTTKRIEVITDQMRVRGWYPGDAGDLANMLAADDAEFVPIQNPEIWAANGGLAAAVAFWPVEKFIMVLRELYNAREQTKQAIYEITGISDIVRGASKSNETLGAQQIKTQWGSLRIQKMQRMMERGARDLFVMMSEIIPAKFSNETLQQMTGVQLIPTQQDLTPVSPPMVQPGMPPEAQQQAAQQAQAAEKARQDKLGRMAAVRQLLQQRLSAMYRIDVESDSTVKADLSRQKAESAEFMQAAGAYWAAVGPLVQQGALSKDVAVEIFAANSRLFNLGKSVEDTLEKMISDAKAQAQQPPQPNAEQQRAQAEAKAREQEAAAKAADYQGKAAEREQQMQFREQEHALTMQEKQFDLRIKQQADRSARGEAMLAAGIIPPPEPAPIDGQAVLQEMAAQREQTGQMLMMLARALMAPKRVVKDQAGRPIGVETVMQEQPGTLQ